MRKPRDEVMAKRMLEARSEGGYRLGTYLRRSVKRYLVMTVLYAVALAIVASTGSSVAFAFCLGMILGAWLRDFAWLRRNQQAWPFTAKIINWDLVEELANLDPVRSDSVRTD